MSFLQLFFDLVMTFNDFESRQHNRRQRAGDGFCCSFTILVLYFRTNAESPKGFPYLSFIERKTFGGF